MAAVSAQDHAQWSSRFAFIMAAVGSSVGLGNLWRFSAEAGRNGGAAFIFIYIAAILLVCLPLLMSEYIVGRAGKGSSAPNSISDLARRSNVTNGWSAFGWIGMIAAFFIVSFYCVVAAWVLRYIPAFLFGEFNGLSPTEISDKFGGFVTNGWAVLPWFLGFAFLTTLMVSRGINKGIEVLARYLMPAFFVMLAGLAIFGIVYNIENGGTAEALEFLYKPEFSKITPGVASAALGQAFFSVGLGSAIMITYGSYLPSNVSLPKSAATVGLIDTMVALIAGFAIFPIIFGLGIGWDTTPGSESGLFFKSLPAAFETMGGTGQILGAVFFFLAFFAAITSSVSLLEPTVAHLSEKTGMTKAKAAWMSGLLMTLVGLFSVFSLSNLDAIDKFTGSVMLPLAGLLTVIFVGWRLDKTILTSELNGAGKSLGYLLLFLARWVAPIFVAVVLVFSIYTKYFAG